MKGPHRPPRVAGAFFYRAAAPARVDIAGGTLDIFPLEIFASPSLTVNAALSLRAEASLRPRRDGKVILRSEDAGVRLVYRSAEDIPAAASRLPLLTAIARRYAFPKGRGWELTTRSGVPRGSGLGGSSALGIALHTVFRRALGMRGIPRERLAAEARTVECAVLGAPAGVQDHYPALYGGAQVLWYRDGGVVREALPAASAAFLERSIVLAYTGQSRLSASTNWRVFRDAFEERRDVRRRLARIGEAALAAREAIVKRDGRQLGEAVAAEWQARRGLAAGIETTRMRDIARAAERAGALASKACGAGGGGCMMFVAREDARSAVEATLRRAGAAVLPVKIAKRGVVSFRRADVVARSA